MGRLSLVGGTVVTLDAERHVFRDAIVTVEDGLIDGVDAGGGGTLDNVIDCRGKLVLPGFVNAHAHTTEVLFRGLGGTLNHLEWVDQKHNLQRLLDESGAEIGTRLACLEMLRSGVVAFLDPEVRAAHLQGIFKAADASRMKAGLAVSIEARHGYGQHGHGREQPSPARLDMPVFPRVSNKVSTWLGPRAMSAITREIGVEIAQYSDANETGITFHCSEDMRDVEAVRTEFGTTPARYAAELGLLSRRSVLAHGVFVEADDLSAIAAAGSSIVHCPSSNAKTGKGIAPLLSMLAAGINVAVGTDGGMSNDSYDLLLELRLIGLLHRASERDAAAVAPELLLEMATLNGAQALGLPGGSIVPGMPADLTVVDMRKLGSWPTQDPVDSLIFASTRHVVDHVLVDGEVLLEEGRAVDFDEVDLLRQAEEVAVDVVRAAGLAASVSDSILPAGAR